MKTITKKTKILNNLKKVGTGNSISIEALAKKVGTSTKSISDWLWCLSKRDQIISTVTLNKTVEVIWLAKNI